MSDPARGKPVDRRAFLSKLLKGVAITGTSAVTAVAATRVASDDDLVWQIDPEKCTQCGNCATHCILSPSAVKCVQAYDMCGYCRLCFGYSRPDAEDLDTAAENQLCPTGAIERTFLEDPYFEYNIIENLCIGCAICVRGCSVFGNASFFLQIRHDRCVNCNECSIAKTCPSDAFVRVPASAPYLIKGEEENS